MDRKNILVLGLVGALALGLSVLGQPHPFVQPQTATSTPMESIATTTTPVVHSSTTQKKEDVPMSRSTTVPSAPVYVPATQTTVTPTQSKPTVHMTIIEPDGKESIDVNLINGDDLCSNLKEAKLEGDIKSLTIDDSYRSVFNSLYVREINGYSNNWTVEVNGVKPEGCSLLKPKAGDQIIWRFGV